ncbi:MAG: hypothetical protein ACREO1_04900 [Arenimonas sp.]
MYKLPENTVMAFEDRGSYLYAEVSGPSDSFEISMAYWTAIAEQVHARDSRCLLVLERLGQYAGERDMTLMIDSIIALGFENVRVAFVDAFVEDLPIVEQGEILAMERGIEGRVFGSVQQADRWLRIGANESMPTAIATPLIGIS